MLSTHPTKQTDKQIQDSALDIHFKINESESIFPGFQLCINQNLEKDYPHYLANQTISQPVNSDHFLKKHLFIKKEGIHLYLCSFIPEILRKEMRITQVRFDAVYAGSFTYI